LRGTDGCTDDLDKVVDGRAPWCPINPRNTPIVKALGSLVPAYGFLLIVCGGLGRPGVVRWLRRGALGHLHLISGSCQRGKPGVSTASKAVSDVSVSPNSRNDVPPRRSKRPYYLPCKFPKLTHAGFLETIDSVNPPNKVSNPSPMRASTIAEIPSFAGQLLMALGLVESRCCGPILRTANQPSPPRVRHSRSQCHK
jgi:hypothetical protein